MSDKHILRMTPSMVLNMLAQLNLNTTSTLSRQALLSGGMIDQQVDINFECGYPDTENLDFDVYKEMYDRESIAARVVDVYPEETWAVTPRIFENEDPEDTPWEEAWKKLETRVRLCQQWALVDKLCGIGDYGVLYLGFDDAQNPNKPAGDEIVDPETGQIVLKGNRKLLYAQPFTAGSATVATYDERPNSSRFGLPTSYTIQTFQPNGVPLGTGATTDDGQAGRTGQAIGQTVHWSRVIHVVDNVFESPVCGQPRMKSVWNRLVDLRKLYGGSAEMFWRGAFPGFAFEVNPDIADPELDATATREEFQNYARSLQRYMAVQGVNVNQLAPQVADPSNHLNALITAVAIRLACPLRVFMGTEEGRLAGDQDGDAWSRRIQRRQERWVTPTIIRPTVERLMQLGVLPPLPGDQEEVKVEWADELDDPSPIEKADTSLKTTQALAAYVAGNVDALLPPADYFTQVLGWDPEQVEAIADSALEAMREEERQQAADMNAAQVAKMQQQQQPPGGPPNGKPPGGPNGEPPGNNKPPAQKKPQNAPA